MAARRKQTAALRLSAVMLGVGYGWSEGVSDSNSCEIIPQCSDSDRVMCPYFFHNGCHKVLLLLPGEGMN